MGCFWCAELKFEGMKSRDLIFVPIEYVKVDLAIQ